MFNCSSQPCQYATFLPCIIISVIVGCLQNHEALWDNDNDSCDDDGCHLPPCSGNWQVMSPTRPCVSSTITNLLYSQPSYTLYSIQARLLYRLVHYTAKARFRDSLWSAYCTKDTCIPKIVLPGRLQALFNIRNLLLTSNCIKLLESVTSAPKPQKDYI